MTVVVGGGGGVVDDVDVAVVVVATAAGFHDYGDIKCRLFQLFVYSFVAKQ